MIEVSISKRFLLERGLEQLITFDLTKQDRSPSSHTKKEYIKVPESRGYKVKYNVEWIYQMGTTQPLEVTLYKVATDYELIPLHKHATICVGNLVNVKKNFEFTLKAKERICLGVKNLSTVDFEIAEANLSLT